MKTYHHTANTLLILTLAILFTAYLQAQEKARFKNIQEVMMAGGQLAGKSGPRSLNWIDNSNRYSYLAINDSTKNEEIRSFNPKIGKDELIFDAKGLMFPDTNEAFSYRSFQWAQDSKHILFETRFKKMYRRSGTSDFFVYSLADKILRIAAKGARTAQLSPDGSMV